MRCFASAQHDKGQPTSSPQRAGMKKVAIFIDWENLRKEIEHCQKYNKASRKAINYNNIDDIAALIQKPLQKDEEIYRIFYYTAEPLSLEWELKNNQDDKIKSLCKT